MSSLLSFHHSMFDSELHGLVLHILLLGLLAVLLLLEVEEVVDTC